MGFWELSCKSNTAILEYIKFAFWKGAVAMLWFW